MYYCAIYSNILLFINYKIIYNMHHIIEEEAILLLIISINYFFILLFYNIIN